MSTRPPHKSTPNGAAIRERREELDLATAAVAARANIAEGTLRNIENGRSGASTRLLHRLSRILNIPFAEITSNNGGGVPEKPPTQPKNPTKDPQRGEQDTKGPGRITNGDLRRAS